MRKIIITSHGSLAEGMLSAAKMILGNCDDIDAYGLDTYKEPKVIFDLIKSKIEENPTDEYVLFSDILGGSVHSKLIELCNHTNVYVVSNMILAMILEMKLATEENTAKILQHTIESSKKGTLIMNHTKALNTINQGLEDDELW